MYHRYGHYTNRDLRDQAVPRSLRPRERSRTKCTEGGAAPYPLSSRGSFRLRIGLAARHGYVLAVFGHQDQELLVPIAALGHRGQDTESRLARELFKAVTDPLTMS